MSKIAIVYVSVHHKNTEKLLQGVQKNCDIDIFDITKSWNMELSNYDIIGFASGIFASKPHKLIYTFLEEHKNLPKKAIVMCTSGFGKEIFLDKFSKLLSNNGFEVIAKFGCKGYNTFGPLKFFGGISKEHPNEEDIQNATKFIQSLP